MQSTLESRQPVEPRIETLEPKTLIGMRLPMSLAEDRTRELWSGFMPRRSEVQNRLTSSFISLQSYSQSGPPAPETVFEKWAVVEVAEGTEPPAGLEVFELAGGLYAVFIHHGPASAWPRTAQHIFGVWLPSSGYTLDARPHFEVLPGEYEPDDPEAEEEVWIPIR